MCYKWFKGVLCECVNSELCDEKLTFMCLLWKTQEIHIILQIVKTLEMLHCYSLLKKQQKLIKQIHVSVFFLNALN